MPGLSPSEIFARKLSSIQHGLPLWYPEPHGSGEVHIGDVGYINDGAFIRVLNVKGNPSDTDKIHVFWKRESPSLETLHDTSLRLDSRDAAIAPGHLTSRGVTRTKVEASAQGCVSHGLVQACVLNVPLVQEYSGRSLHRHEGRIQVRRRMWCHASTQKFSIIFYSHQYEHYQELYTPKPHILGDLRSQHP